MLISEANNEAGLFPAEKLDRITSFLELGRLLHFDKFDCTCSTCNYASGHIATLALIADNRFTRSPVWHNGVMWADHDAHRTAHAAVSIEHNASRVGFDGQCNGHACGDALRIFAQPANRLKLVSFERISEYLYGTARVVGHTKVSDGAGNAAGTTSGTEQVIRIDAPYCTPPPCPSHGATSSAILSLGTTPSSSQCLS